MPSADHSLNTSDEDADGQIALATILTGVDITTIDSDPERWHKDWEEALRTFTARDVFEFLKEPMANTLNTPDQMSRMLNTLRNRVQESQSLAAMTWDGEDHDDEVMLATMWVLSEEQERRKYLMRGIETACKTAVWKQESRAVCPEITVGAMMKKKGKAYMDFMKDYLTALKAAQPNVYLLPSAWWAKAVDTSQELTETDKQILEILTLLRNEFILTFVLGARLSFMEEINNPGPEMKKVMDILAVDPTFTMSMTRALSRFRSKPTIRCENCTKSPNMIDGNPKFMVCSACKSKLDFVVHYCSEACQKQDWRRHKKNCGKAKVSKQLEGTVNDPFWYTPDVPDHLRDLLPAGVDENGRVVMKNLGFGKSDPSRPYSSALQRQISLLEGDKEADYFLFDEVQRPIRVLLPESMYKMTFRILRSDAFSGPDKHGAQVIGEFLVKIMSNRPGLSRARILEQFSREYGEGIISKIEAMETRAVRDGQAGVTFLERSGGHLTAAASAMGMAWPA